MASRVVKELLQSGVQVVAGVLSRTSTLPLMACGFQACTALPHQWHRVASRGMLSRTAAGVPEGDPADDALDFALQFELIKKSEAKALTIQEVDFADPDSFGIPR